MSSILTSSKLIRSIKIKAMIPEDQRTFTAEYFLEMATEKVNIELMDQVMTARGDYLVYFEDIKILPGVYEYAIPDRSHGNKLRDAAIVDSSGNSQRELTQISLDDLNDYHNDRAMLSNFEPFYLRNNMLVLINHNHRSDSYVRMYFYMRPNKLVVEERAATVSQVSTGFEMDNIAPQSGAITNITLDGVVTSPNHGLTSGMSVIINGTNSVPAIDGLQMITYIDTDTFSVSVSLTQPGTSGSYNLAAEVVTLPSAIFPKHFTTNIMYDVVQGISPNKIKLYNLIPNSVNNTMKTISFRVADGADKIIKGDYITKSEETIVPNMPTEYHPVLAQMVVVSCLESMGDEKATARATITLEKMMKSVLRIVTNRVEGAPKKIKQRNGTLQQTNRARNFRRN